MATASTSGLSGSRRSSGDTIRRSSISSSASDNGDFFKVERTMANNCSRVVWSLDNSLIVYVGERDNSWPSEGLYFIEVGNSVLRNGVPVNEPKRITSYTGVSHVVHCLQTGPLVLVLQQATARDCRVTGDDESQWRYVMARRNAIICGYALEESSTGRTAQLRLKVSLQFYSALQTGHFIFCSRRSSELKISGTANPPIAS